jgi:hypothetical protein
MAKRTILRFETKDDIWPIVESWAKERDYREKSRGDTWCQYRQGYGLLVAPKAVEVRQEGTTVEIQGWVINNIVNRIMFLFLMPAEVDLGKGFMATIPRGTARRDVNILLERLGQPPIKV